jgi:sterol desaturase/sphingolipid hydroxylase (fatty acid hydroxylase superfamily)
MPAYANDLFMMRSIVFWGALVLLLAIEFVRPYRQPSVSKKNRVITNVSLAALNGVLIYFIFSSAIASATGQVSAAGSVPLRMINLPAWGSVLTIIVLMDFVTYVWHYMNHKVPIFWRFHRVHHSDLNMDVSTASRFHIGELAVSSLIKIGAVLALGIDLAGLAIFEGTLMLAAQFQHSSIKVSPLFEKYFIAVFIPPSMHRVHHSVVINERDSNYGTIFSVWDRIFGTFSMNVDQDRVVIGMGAYRDFTKLALRHLLRMPFSRAVR